MSSAAIIAIAVVVVVVLARDRVRSPLRAAATCAAPARSAARRASATSDADDRSARRAPPAREVERAAERGPRRHGARQGRAARARCRGCRPIPRRSASAAGSSSTVPRRADERRPRRASPPPASSPSCGRPASGGFGGKVSVGKLDDILASIRRNSGFFYSPERPLVDHARTRPRRCRRPKACRTTSRCSPAWTHGIVALYQKCPHLGCRVPRASSSQWFECPCHGSQYNRVGEKKGGPAPRGMDHFAVTVGAGGDVIDRHRRRVVTGAADRHQHHRPRGRGSALHHGRRWTRMIAGSTTTSVAWVIFARHRRRLDRRTAS